MHGIINTVIPAGIIQKNDEEKVMVDFILVAVLTAVVVYIWKNAFGRAIKNNPGAPVPQGDRPEGPVKGKDGDDTPAEPAYEKMSVKQLKEVLVAAGVSGVASANKAKLVDMAKNNLSKH